MVIRETYVKDSKVMRMTFVPQSQYRGDRTKIDETMSYADILTTSKSQIQVKCEREEYLVALNSLKNYRPQRLRNRRRRYG